MKKSWKVVVLILVYVSMLKMHSQGNTVTTVNDVIMEPYQEQIYVHTNSNMVFVGEYLYYTIYCLKENTGQLSHISKIAYLKLVNENKEVVLNQKIKLQNGIGDSSFFIPSRIPSGNYKLVAYTQWMLNNGRNYFYSEDVTVLNPYTSDQAVFRIETKNDSVIPASNKIGNTLHTSSYNSPIRLELNKTNYTERELISVKLSSSNTSNTLGNYSISVRKVDELAKKVDNSSLVYQKRYPSKTKIERLILPELRGELFIGELTNSENAVAENHTIGVSFPGEDYLFKIASTDRNGRFYVNVDEEYNAEEVYMQVLDKGSNDYEMKLRPEESLVLQGLKFGSFILNRKMDSLITQRSIHNQIENAYYSSKPDTILIGKPNDRFYGPSTLNYVLDEYTRFPTIRETFIEVVEHVWIQENENGQVKFHVRPIAPYVESGRLPLVFVDGVLLTDHERLINLSAAQVESINISRNQHFYGTETFQGVVDITTFKADFYKSYYTDNLLTHKLFKPNENKNYYRQSYKGDLREEYRRLPDFRYQLLWEPKFEMKSKEHTIEFFSSDIQGEFEISLEGFTESGIPVSLIKNFWVK
ncbi:hypothetical protein ACNR9Q_10880 [Maribacter sp. X9]|uniref:hypothetical protein n=1 Tax=Maribacter sp. X9 TaxID=3402159 RepID=UPI003AF3669A